tara:strand:- start:823 stop:948 length:126 start_codon:yes stop_codon:yes gene_type:complete
MAKKINNLPNFYRKLIWKAESDSLSERTLIKRLNELIRQGK